MQTQYSMLQIRTIPKNISTSYILKLLSFIYLTTISELLYKLSEETTQRKHTHTHVTILSLVKNKKPFSR